MESAEGVVCGGTSKEGNEGYKPHPLDRTSLQGFCINVDITQFALEVAGPVLGTMAYVAWNRH